MPKFRGRSRSRERYSQPYRNDYHTKRYRSDLYKSHESSDSFYERQKRRRDDDLLDDASIVPIDQRKPKTGLWDIPPPEYKNLTVQQVKDLNVFPIPGLAPKRPRPRSAAPSVDSEGSGSKLYAESGYHATTADSHALRLAKRIYVGGMLDKVDTDNLTRLFDETMHLHKLAEQDGSCILHCQTCFSNGRNYVFFTMRSIDEATNALALNGISYLGASLKVSRPKDFVPIQGHAVDPPDVHIPGIISPMVRDSPYKLYIGSIPVSLKEAEVRGLLETFGPLRSFNLIMDAGTGLNKGYAFAEFVNSSTSETACQGLNGMAIGDKKIMVHFANEHKKTSPIANINAAGGGAYSDIYALNSADAASPLHCRALFERMEHRGLSSASFSDIRDKLNPSRVILLLNLFTPDDLLRDDDFSAICDDIKLESVKYGRVESIAIPRPIENRPASGLGRVFIEYSSVSESENALFSLSGRKFLDRTVLGTFYPEKDYINNIYISQ